MTDLTFVVRAAGERTAPAATALLRTLVARAGGDAAGQVTVVEERPFVNAVRRTLEIGLEAGRPWVVGMDADVLLLPDAIERLGRLCAGATERTYTITTLVLCRFFGGFCFRGIHLYPRRLLGEALPLVGPSGAAASLRPETAVVQAMLARGYEMQGPPVPVGVHDFEQHLRHVYVKMRLRARRETADDGGRGFAAYRAFVAGRANAGEPDFTVALWGLDDGRVDSLHPDAPAQYDWAEQADALAPRLAAAGLGERPPLPPSHGASVALGAISAHDFSADGRTPKWIRDRLGFTRGHPHVLAAMGLAGGTEDGPGLPGAARTAQPAAA